jgi:asparagine synthase (glutamine-hydrolysing)
MAARKILGPDVPLHTFSSIADEAFLSEEKWIDILAGSAGAQVHKVCPSPDRLVEDLNGLLAAQDEPIGSISPYAQYCVFRLAHENAIKVTLDGQGADEYLAGYDKYHVMGLAGALRTGDWRRGLRLAANAARESRSPLPRPVSMAQRIAANSEEARMAAPVPLGARADYFKGHQVVRPPQFVSRSERVLDESLRWSVTQGLPELLCFADRNSMAFSIESRVPFLTVPLVECVLSLPESYILGSNAERKRFFGQPCVGSCPTASSTDATRLGSPFLNSTGSASSAIGSWTFSTTTAHGTSCRSSHSSCEKRGWRC